MKCLLFFTLLGMVGIANAEPSGDIINFSTSTTTYFDPSKYEIIPASWTCEICGKNYRGDWHFAFMEKDGGPEHDICWKCFYHALKAGAALWNSEMGVGKWKSSRFFGWHSSQGWRKPILSRTRKKVIFTHIHHPEASSPRNILPCHLIPMR